eukprot:974023-Pleurochrysis_carterae.AAC.2
MVPERERERERERESGDTGASKGAQIMRGGGEGGGCGLRGRVERRGGEEGMQGGIENRIREEE